MLKTLLTCLLTLHPGDLPVPVEPAGIRLSGTIPRFQADPIPPDWVRLESHLLADPDCRHYEYEVYAGDTQWLVRYVEFPEDGESFREIEQVFLYPREKGKSKVERIRLADLQFDLQTVHWKGRTYRLVDRRDLIRE